MADPAKTWRRTALLLRAMSPFTYVGDYDPSEGVQPAHFHLITSIDLITNEKRRIMRISWNGSVRFKFVRRVIANCEPVRKDY
jgi:hypothetical protein